MLHTIDNFPIKKLEVGDQVKFTNELTYDVASTHLLLQGRGEGRNNALIFKVLGMDERKKNEFCHMVYGYRSEGLFNKFATLADGVKIVNALFTLLYDKEQIKTKPKVEIIEKSEYTDYIIGRTKIRLFGNPLTIIKHTVADDNKIGQSVPEEIRGRLSGRGHHSFSEPVSFAIFKE